MSCGREYTLNKKLDSEYDYRLSNYLLLKDNRIHTIIGKRKLDDNEKITAHELIAEKHLRALHKPIRNNYIFVEPTRNENLFVDSLFSTSRLSEFDFENTIKERTVNPINLKDLQYETEIMNMDYSKLEADADGYVRYKGKVLMCKHDLMLIQGCTVEEMTAECYDSNFHRCRYCENSLYLVNDENYDIPTSTFNAFSEVLNLIKSSTEYFFEYNVPLLDAFTKSIFSFYYIHIVIDTTKTIYTNEEFNKIPADYVKFIGGLIIVKLIQELKLEKKDSKKCKHIVADCFKKISKYINNTLDLQRYMRITNITPIMEILQLKSNFVHSNALTDVFKELKEREAESISEINTHTINKLYSELETSEYKKEIQDEKYNRTNSHHTTNMIDFTSNDKNESQQEIESTNKIITIDDYNYVDCSSEIGRSYISYDRDMETRNQIKKTFEDEKNNQNIINNYLHKISEEYKINVSDIERIYQTNSLFNELYYDAFGESIPSHDVLACFIKLYLFKRYRDDLMTLFFV